MDVKDGHEYGNLVHMFIDKPVVENLLNQDNFTVGRRYYRIFSFRYNTFRIPEKIEDKSRQ